MRIYLTAVVCAMAVASLSACVTPDVYSGAASRALDLTGTWRSEAPEPLPGAGGDTNYLVREFVFEQDLWRIAFTIYDDATATAPLVSGENSGRFIVDDLGGEGGAEAEFSFERRSLTPRTPAIAQALSGGGCGAAAWVVGEAQSVLDRGCPAFRVFSRAACEREFDRIRLDGARLYLGARPADGFMCTPDLRPATVGAGALVRSRE
jgi:hypothetical protein